MGDNNRMLSNKGENVLEYRVGQLEATLQDIRKSINDVRSDLQKIVLGEHFVQSVEERISVCEREVDTLKGDFSKWFNRVVGVAATVVVLGGAMGWWIRSGIDSVVGAVNSISAIDQRVQQLEKRSANGS